MGGGDREAKKMLKERIIFFVFHECKVPINRSF